MTDLPAKSARSRWLEQTILALAIAVPVAFTIHAVAIDDLFFALAGGRWILENGQLPLTDPFSWTRDGSPWVNYTWLFNVAAYALHQIVGLNGLILCFAALTGLIFWLMTRFCRQLGIGVSATALLVLIAALLGRGRLAYFRPEYVTMLCGVLTMFLLERSRDKNSLLWLFPPMLWVWSNAHGGFPMGLVLLALYAIGALVEKSFERLKTISLVLLASLVACVANPYGTKLIENVLWHMRPGASRALIVEWQPTIGTEFAVNSLTVGIFLTTVAVGAIGFLLNRKRTNWSRLLAFFALAALAWQGRRFVSLFGLLALPLAAIEWLQWWGYRRRLSPTVVIAAAMTGAVTLLLTASPRLGIDPLLNPVAAVEFMKAESKRGLRMMNDMNFAVYQMWTWRNQKTFIDLRNVLFGDEFFREYVGAFASRPGWEKLDQRWNIDAVMISSFAPGNSALIGTLNADPRWKRVYFDEVAVVFVRAPSDSELNAGGVRDPNDRNEVKAWRERKIAQQSRADGVRFRLQWATALFQIGAKESGRAELEDLLATGERPHDALRLLAVLALESNDGIRAEKLLGEILQRWPDNSNAHLLVATALARSGKRGAALDEVARAIALAPNNVAALLLEADLAEQTNDLPRAERALRRATKLYALPNPDPLLRLAAVLEKQGKPADALEHYRRAANLLEVSDARHHDVVSHIRVLESSSKLKQ